MDDTVRNTAKDVLRLMTRRSRSGQSIIIIALGFIALIAFVGIATDTALLFVRFSTLRRAVDAAAVAAAGQVRENSTYGNVVAAAQQYIKIHGLDPTSVKVETCETEIYDYIQKHPGQDGFQAKAALIGSKSELCRPDPAKLVRVSAQITSPTTFLSIIGYQSILLSASSLSQTAVMDVALLLDGSLSEALDTASLTKASGAALQDRLPGFAIGQPDSTGFTLGLAPYDSSNPGGTGGTKGSIRFECADKSKSSSGQDANYAWGGCCNDPTTQYVANPDTNSYIDSVTGAINTSIITSGAKDGNYSDLVCHPFKEVRDATRRFLNKIDFVRGDRVMLVEFDSHLNVVTVDGQPNSVPVFVSRFDAINALNRYMGIEINANGSWSNCLTINNPPYRERQAFYETIAPCPDTNTGGAIQTAQYLLTNPNWIRRDAVWITVLLSDGYPNRTPGLGASQPTTWSASIHKIPNAGPGGAGLGYPTKDLNGTFFDTLLNPDPALTDPGFCPWYTFCDRSAGASTGKAYLAPGTVEWNNLYCLENDNPPIWWNSSGHATTFSENAAVGPPFCSDNNPDSRHFCMNILTGVINPLDHPEYCSPHYDPDDFARDRVDFAALTDYTNTKKGNFIAMFAIFFPHSGGNSNLNDNILGVKFMRYVADAGDNGVIDNHLQKWYRNAIQASNTNVDPRPPDATDPFNDSVGYNGTDPRYNDPAAEDPCAKYDFREVGTSSGAPAGGVSPDFPDGNGYEGIYKTSCGNYYYAGNPGAVDRAFADIAGRLFTRLAR